MNASRQHIALDLNGQGSMEYVNVRQGDTAKVVSAGLVESGIPYQLADDVTAVLAARAPDGTYSYAAATISENRIIVMIPASITAKAGMHSACFRLSGSNEAALITPTFAIVVNAPAAPEQSQGG